MISVKKALELAETFFPRGPEAIAERLGVRVISCEMNGCDGWCLAGEDVTIIRVNESATVHRQRFTLAHELAHLLLGMSGDILPSGAYFSTSHGEEKEANKLASELLIPRPHLQKLVRSVPVDAVVLRRLARQAKVSEVVAAHRVARLAKELGLVNGAVIGFENDRPKWNWSDTLNIELGNEVVWCRLLEKARNTPSGLHRVKNSNGEMVVATALGSPEYPVLFVQVLPAELGEKRSKGEVLKELEVRLYEGDRSFCNKLNGRFGSFKPKAASMTFDEAVAAFNARYSTGWDNEAHEAKFNGAICQKYVRLRLRDMCRR